MRLASCFAFAAAVLAGTLSAPTETRAEVKFQFGYGAIHGKSDGQYYWRPAKRPDLRAGRHGAQTHKRQAYNYRSKPYAYTHRHPQARYWDKRSYRAWPPRAYPRHAWPPRRFTARHRAWPCRNFTGTLSHRDGRRRMVVSTSCLRLDGRWHRVR